MKRSTTRNASDRVSVSAARGTIESVNDDPKMQEVGVKFLHDEQADTVEHMLPYGMSFKAQPPDGSGKAEAVAIFLNGNRSHALVVAVGDRRYRLKGLKDGEFAIHDDQGQKVHFTRAGTVIDGGSKKLPITANVGDTRVTIKDKAVTVDPTSSGTVTLGGHEGDGGTYDFVMTASGRSTNVKARKG